MSKVIVAVLMSCVVATEQPAEAHIVPTETVAPEPSETAATTVTAAPPWQTAKASWYGPGLFGNRTACGQRYTRNLLGVAHRTLPCGTMVTFRFGGREVTVPVIDRGPFVRGRTWDLSAALCRSLNHCFTQNLEWRMA